MVQAADILFVLGIGEDDRLSHLPQNKLLSSKAKNPYAAYASSCESCKTKTEQGKKFCQRCAYQRNGMSCIILELLEAAFGKDSLLMLFI